MSLIRNHEHISLGEDDKDRISLGVDDGIGPVVLRGADGRARLRLEVDEESYAHVEGLNRPPASK